MLLVLLENEIIQSNVANIFDESVNRNKEITNKVMCSPFFKLVAVLKPL
jgi:hypothetical protein